MKALFVTFIASLASMSSPLFANTSDVKIGYVDLLPKRNYEQNPSKSTSALNEALQETAPAFNSCLSILNTKDALKANGKATARSGSILIEFRYASESRSADVVTSAFRYDAVESCLVRTLNNMTVPEESRSEALQADVRFDISCELHQLPGTALLPNGKIERKCVLDWKTHA